MDKKNDNIFERHPRQTLFCFLLATILIFDFLSANIYRFLNGYSWATRNEGQYRIKEEQHRLKEVTYRIPSKFYHHDLAAKKTIYKSSLGPNVYNIYTNSLGFKDRSIRDISLTTNTHRIVFIGDSFTEGLGIDYENTFVGLIDTALSKKKIEVLNAGVCSYSPIIYWRKVKYLIENVGLKFDQLVVFIDISDTEDEAIYYSLDEIGNVVKSDARELSQGSAESKKDEKYYVVLLKRLKVELQNNSILTYAILHNLRGMFFPQEKAKSRYTFVDIRCGWTIDDKVYREYGEQGLGEMELYMDRLHDLLKRNNIKLTVAVYPWPVQIMYHDLNSIQVKFWDKWCKMHDVNLINYFPYFVTGNTEDDKKQLIDKYYIKNDVHWNEEGHRLIANVFLADYSKQNNL